MGSRLHLGIAAAIAIALAGCTGASAAPAKAVNITVSEFKIASDASKVAAGEVTFTIKNMGSATHEFVVVRTDLSPDKLPKNADGEVEEGGPLTAVDEVEDIAPGTTKTLVVKLDAGKYAVFCNLPGHYAGGMHSGIDVVAS
jgi:uncharacterized cupredoxin-like copper-binding protein